MEDSVDQLLVKEVDGESVDTLKVQVKKSGINSKNIYVKNQGSATTNSR